MSADGRLPAAAPLGVRAHPLVLGAVMFLASELMFFAALFAAYYDLRGDARGPWPPPGAHLDGMGAAAGTALLGIASIVMVLAGRALERRRIDAARWWTAAAIAAGAGFIAVALRGYAHTGLSVASNAYGSIYYTLTGFHVLHVIAGVGVLCAIALGLRSRSLRADGRAGFEAMTYYWHFVFVVWLGIWATVYFVR